MSHKRDEEIKRILLYAKGLGIRIRIANYSWDDSGEWAHSPVSEININKRVHTSKTELILTMLHEIGHHLHYIHNNKAEIPDTVLLELDYKKQGKKVPKKERKKLYEYEASGISFMEIIATELGLTIPNWKVKKAMEFDTWVYEYYYNVGNYPNKDQLKTKNKELNLKYRGK